ncbi:MAG: efflux RND transporter periplasmic adaptor subunit [Lautropia sp.]
MPPRTTPLPPVPAAASVRPATVAVAARAMVASAANAPVRVAAQAGPSPWQTLAGLQQRAAAAGSVAELGFVAVNETWQLAPYRQAVLWRLDARGAPVLQAVSGLARLAEDSPNTIWLRRLGRWLAKAIAARAARAAAKAAPAASENRPATPSLTPSAAPSASPSAAPSASPSAAPSATPFTTPFAIGPAALPAALAAPWPEFMPAHGWVLPLAAPHGGRLLGILLLACDELPEPARRERLAQAAFSYGHAWAALIGRAAAAPTRPARLRLAGWLLALAALACLALPVRLSVLAPAEVIALDALAVTAPMDGVVKRFAVEPNQTVARDALLFSFDDTTLRNRREVAQKQLQVARAEALAAAQKAFASDASRAELAALNGRVAERQAELGWLDEQLQRIEVRAPAAGVVVFGDVNDWIGKPLVTGERVALLADPRDAGVLIWLPVADALNIEPGAEVRLFLQTAPLTPLPARLSQTSYQSLLSPDGVASYRLRARFDALDPALAAQARIGLRGTAKIFGERAPLGYYLLRRPLAALRELSGW